MWRMALLFIPLGSGLPFTSLHYTQTKEATIDSQDVAQEELLDHGKEFIRHRTNF